MIIALVIAGIVLVILIVVIRIFLPKLRIATAYRAKYEASHAVLSNLSHERIDHALNFFPVKYVRSSTSSDQSQYKASILGLAGMVAQTYHNGTSAGAIIGKTQFEKLHQALPVDVRRSPSEPWPVGDFLPSGLDLQIQELAETYLKRDFGIHAITVANRDHLLAEAYNPGTSGTSRFLGWSMTKTIANALIGSLVHQGRLDVHSPAPVKEWQSDARSKITIRDLLQMQSGLEWSEDYGNVSDVTRMLYSDSNVYQSAINRPFEKVKNSTNASAVEGCVNPGEIFNYSSGTSNVLSGIIRSCFDTQEAYLQFPKETLFDPLGMDSALIETDPAGNFILSSYGWATARDWTRFGLLYLYQGDWFGRQVFSKSWCQDSLVPASRSQGKYGYHLWLNAPDDKGEKDLPQVPSDAFYEEGVFGQRILIIPSKNLVISVFSGRMNDEVFKTFFNDFYNDVLSLSATKP